MKTERQMKNAHNRASQRAYDVVKAEQTDNFAATSEQMYSERGEAMNAAGFAARALDHLTNGDYEGFLTCMRLGGQFAQKASDARYARTPR